MTDYLCVVCERPISDDPHTYHAEGCPSREWAPCAVAPCANLPLCGEDVHDEHCPVCTGQAF